MESMTRLKKIDFEDIFRNFVDWYSGDKFTANDFTFDFDPITEAAIKNFLKGYYPKDCGISDEYSNENGALIRMLPVAAYIYLTRGNNFDNDAMKIIHYEFLLDKNFAATPEKNITISVYVVYTLKAALWCLLTTLLTTDNYRDLILKAVNLGGDTDTVAAIAGGLGGAFYDVEQIPQN